MVSLKRKKHEGDLWVLVLTVAISLFGVVMDFSAGYYVSLSKYGDPLYYLKNAGMWFVIGWAAFLICSYMDYHIFRLFAIPAIVVGFGLLLLLFTSLGRTWNNATRWLEIGPVTIMPGEIMKTCVILFFAWFLAYDPERIKSWKGVLTCFVILAASFVLIYKQPNFSTAIIVAALIAGMMFLAGLNWKLVTIVVVGGVSLITVLILYLKLTNPDSYILSRLTSFTDPFADPLGDGWQVCQGLLAMGSGGVTGVGLGNSIQKAFYLPEPTNDFILAIIGEELGFVGILALMTAYLGLVYAILSVALRARDRFGMLIAGGVGLHLGLQVILNIAVVTASAPPTGVALPLITLGGNSLVLFMAELGIVYNISKSAKTLAPEAAEPEKLKMKMI